MADKVDPQKVKHQMYLMVLIVLAFNVLLFLAHACLSDRDSGKPASEGATPRVVEPAEP